MPSTEEIKAAAQYYMYQSTPAMENRVSGDRQIYVDWITGIKAYRGALDPDQFKIFEDESARVRALTADQLERERETASREHYQSFVKNAVSFTAVGLAAPLLFGPATGGLYASTTAAPAAAVTAGGSKVASLSSGDIAADAMNPEYIEASQAADYAAAATPAAAVTAGGSKVASLSSGDVAADAMNPEYIPLAQAQDVAAFDTAAAAMDPDLIAYFQARDVADAAKNTSLFSFLGNVVGGALQTTADLAAAVAKPAVDVAVAVAKPVADVAVGLAGAGKTTLDFAQEVIPLFSSIKSGIDSLSGQTPGIVADSTIPLNVGGDNSQPAGTMYITPPSEESWEKYLPLIIIAVVALVMKKK